MGTISTQGGRRGHLKGAAGIVAKYYYVQKSSRHARIFLAAITRWAPWSAPISAPKVRRQVWLRLCRDRANSLFIKHKSLYINDLRHGSEIANCAANVANSLPPVPASPGSPLLVRQSRKTPVKNRESERTAKQAASPGFLISQSS